MDQKTEEVLSLVSILLVVVLIFTICVGWAGCERWQFNECLAGGNSHEYCIARSTGCMK